MERTRLMDKILTLKVCLAAINRSRTTFGLHTSFHHTL